MAESSSTEPFVLGPASGPAVLLLHGFTGSPWEMRVLGESLAARGFHVRAPRLPGHGTTPEAMLEVSWRDWLGAAEAELGLFPPGPVAVSGLSMGGLLGLMLAARFPERVTALGLMAVAWKLRQRASQVLRVLRHFDLPPLRGRWIQKDTTDIDDDVVRSSAPILRRYPMARLYDLFTLQDVARESLPKVKARTLIIGALKDHVVRFDGLEQLHRLLPGSRLLALQRGFHIIPRDYDRALVCTELAEFLDRRPPG